MGNILHSIIQGELTMFDLNPVRPQRICHLFSSRLWGLVEIRGGYFSEFEIGRMRVGSLYVSG